MRKEALKQESGGTQERQQGVLTTMAFLQGDERERKHRRTMAKRKET